MKHYLVVYDRSLGSIVRFVEYAQADVALNARFAAEDEFAGNAAIEIVVLSSASEAVLRKTHARYFQSVREIALDGLMVLDRQEAALRARLAS